MIEHHLIGDAQLVPQIRGIARRNLLIGLNGGLVALVHAISESPSSSGLEETAEW
jgi:hypothetical protein